MARHRINASCFSNVQFLFLFHMRHSLRPCRRSVKKKNIVEPQPIIDSSGKPVRRGSDGTPYVYAKGAIVPKTICRKIIEYAIDGK
jgi:hypothetical protein